MGRAGIYKSEVVRARDRLLAMGRYPSIDAVRTELGDTGSKATIHRYLKEIEEEQGGATGTKVAVSEAIQDLVGRLASQLHEEAESRVTDASGKHVAKVQQLTEAIAALKSEADSARAVREQTQLALAAEQQAHARTAAELRDRLLDRAKLAQEVSDLRERLAKEEEHRQSLEDKHKQARESLEHFRQAAKEQREQEHRKHDQEVQYLQSELRNVNQALTQKQQETTHAHQECTRLLGELVHAQADLHATLEEVRTLKEQNGSLAYAKKQVEEFGKQLVQLQATVKVLEESKAQVQVLAEGMVGDKRRLELELATARATLETQKVITDAILRRFDGGDSDQAQPNVEPQGQLLFAEAKVQKSRSKT
jgi:chromosome segregation ATPase